MRKELRLSRSVDAVVEKLALALLTYDKIDDLGRARSGETLNLWKDSGLGGLIMGRDTQRMRRGVMLVVGLHVSRQANEGAKPHKTRLGCGLFQQDCTTICEVRTLLGIIPRSTEELMPGPARTSAQRKPR